AQPDMRLPIQIALAWPNRMGAPADLRVDRSNLTWTLEPPDRNTFRCLDLAYEAGRKGDTYPAVLNAANEMAVRSFIEERISFVDIPTVVERVLELHEPTEPRIEDVLEQDEWARGKAMEVIAAL
ncbi:MAG TPA: 1-deoxy-D-xylulose-5-phosphate reductoisomerase, partial [Actinomycetota bacterium]|nr:1-deoxy-D-xylulose-5-phosphate reductoisomerase [Actinomycetota bacterium]